MILIVRRFIQIRFMIGLGHKSKINRKSVPVKVSPKMSASSTSKF
jgi:hypothetical protein